MKNNVTVMIHKVTAGFIKTKLCEEAFMMMDHL